MDKQTNLNAVILTAIPLEYQAIRAHLKDLQEEIHPEGTLYERGVFLASNRRWEVGIAETRKGSANAAFEAGRAIDYFKPQVVLFVGIAGGLKDVLIGDVVAATKVYGYESGKASKTFLPRPEIGQSTYRMIQRAQKEARDTVWFNRSIKSNVTPQPRVFVDAIAAGEKVIDSTRSATYQFLRKQYSDAIAVEMEGYGFLQATRANQHVEALIIRGISDLIDNKNVTDKNNSQEIAANHASAFAFEILSKLTPPELQGAFDRRSSESVLSNPTSTSSIRQQTTSGNIIAPIGDNGHNVINYTEHSKRRREKDA
ncbi:nucleosidase [Dictyobacter alpinus]|uniref:Nucleosidase n=1 Tax=Dictyobacter alpinus TaxID=2014873 RepID=A0A402B8C7_9CHLR|nr:5'-methylthioadenosine/S-adenosylhomocysteine nucleosidase [Dictyobacter alpinus]GCE27579.1 nucleosidase [Dictyobacter alpinus]